MKESIEMCRRWWGWFPETQFEEICTFYDLIFHSMNANANRFQKIDRIDLIIKEYISKNKEERAARWAYYELQAESDSDST